MIDHDLVRYIKKLMSEGKSKDEIKEILVAQLFDLNSIDDSLAAVNMSEKVLDKMDVKPAVDTGRVRKGLFITAAILVVLLAIGSAGLAAYQAYNSPLWTFEGNTYHLDQNKKFDINPDGDKVIVRVNMSSQLYREYKQKRAEIYENIIMDKKSFSRSALWASLLATTQEDYFLEEFTSGLQTAVAEGRTPHKGRDAPAYYAIEFTQGMHRDYLRDWTYAKDKKLPYETLYSKQGSEHDKAILLAKLLNKAGYASAVIEIPELRHTVTGIQCNIDVRKIQGYCIIEPNAKATIEESGNYQSEFLGVPYRRLSEKAFIVHPVGEGRAYNAELS